MQNCIFPQWNGVVRAREIVSSMNGVNGWASFSHVALRPRPEVHNDVADDDDDDDGKKNSSERDERTPGGVRQTSETPSGSTACSWSTSHLSRTPITTVCRHEKSFWLAFRVHSGEWEADKPFSQQLPVRYCCVCAALCAVGRDALQKGKTVHDFCD